MFLHLLHLRLVGPAELSKAQFQPSSHQSPKHLGRCSTHRAYWPRHRARCGAKGLEMECKNVHKKMKNKGRWYCQNKMNGWRVSERVKMVEVVIPPPLSPPLLQSQDGGSTGWRAQRLQSCSPAAALLPPTLDSHPHRRCILTGRP